MAGKQYEVIRDFRHSCPKSYVDTHYSVGDTYTGDVNDNQIADEGPDGEGPVLREKAASSSSSNAKASSDSQEK